MKFARGDAYLGIEVTLSGVYEGENPGLIHYGKMLDG